MIPIPSYESDSAPFLEMGIMEEQGPYSHVASRAMWEAPSREDFPPAPAGEAPGAVALCEVSLGLPAPAAQQLGGWVWPHRWDPSQPPRHLHGAPLFQAPAPPSLFYLLKSEGTALQGVIT